VVFPQSGLTEEELPDTFFKYEMKGLRRVNIRVENVADEFPAFAFSWLARFFRFGLEDVERHYFRLKDHPNA